MKRSALPSRLARAALLAFALALTSVGTAGAAPAALPTNCTQAGNAYTCTFTRAGETPLTLPPAVTWVTATAVGAQGGRYTYNGAPGGLGAQATGTFGVTEGQTLYINVNVMGGRRGKLPIVAIPRAGDGGGESDVRTCSPTAPPCTRADLPGSRLLVAGGGGGSGSSSGPGGNAGTTGAAGNGGNGPSGKCNTSGGTGATQTAPGAGGVACGHTNGGPGTIGGGGAGADSQNPDDDPEIGGGGGGGWYGGGGGAGGGSNNEGGAGGGGSSYAAPSVSAASFTQAADGQAPSVTLTFTDPCAPSGSTVTCTYTRDGESRFTVPSGVSSIAVTAVGGGGGPPQGLGAVATGTIPVTAGQTLYADVNMFGGEGGIQSGRRGGGGTDVRTCSFQGSCDTLNSRLLVAGGGGGAGGNPLGLLGLGGNAGTTGNADDGARGDRGSGGGAGATRSAGGKAGAYGGGVDGTFGFGGAGDSSGWQDSFGQQEGGGGGGGGWYGGGGGTADTPANSNGGGGGGGTSYAAPSVTGATFVLGAVGQGASVTITYTLPASAIQISRIQYDAPGPDTRRNKSLNREWVRIKNTGTSARQLRGWSIADEDGHVYRFKPLVLRPRATVTLHTGRGRDRAAHRYWNRTRHVWDNARELARLRKPGGKLAYPCRYDKANAKRARC